MSALICGSFAYDTIMTFPSPFSDHILPDQLHQLNVAFLVPELRQEFGGCAGNIAYNLNLLGDTPIPMATVGHDFTRYAQWMDQHGLSRQYLMTKADHYTAQAYITTDSRGNQMTAFHPGAMNCSHEIIIDNHHDISLAIVSPDGRQGMISHAEQLAAANIPFIFDPGQGLPMFDGQALHHFIEQADYMAVNAYEAELCQHKMGMSLTAIAQQLEALIVTRGAQGSTIYHDGQEIIIPSAAVSQVKDPTGCGDAYRAGLIHGILHQLSWEKTGRIASLLGALKIEHAGTQNHTFDAETLAERYQQSFGSALS